MREISGACKAKQSPGGRHCFPGRAAGLPAHAGSGQRQPNKAEGAQGARGTSSTTADLTASAEPGFRFVGPSLKSALAGKESRSHLFAIFTLFFLAWHSNAPERQSQVCGTPWKLRNRGYTSADYKHFKATLLFSEYFCRFTSQGSSNHHGCTALCHSWTVQLSELKELVRIFFPPSM